MLDPLTYLIVPPLVLMGLFWLYMLSRREAWATFRAKDGRWMARRKVGGKWEYREATKEETEESDLFHAFR